MRQRQHRHSPVRVERYEVGALVDVLLRIVGPYGSDQVELDARREDGPTPRHDRPEPQQRPERQIAEANAVVLQLDAWGGGGWSTARTERHDRQDAVAADGRAVI